MTKIIFKDKQEYFIFTSFKIASSYGSFLWWFERNGNLIKNSNLIKIKQINLDAEL